MSDHFRLRKSHEARVVTDQRVDTHVRIMHAVAVIAMFAAVVGLAASFFGVSGRWRYLRNSESGGATYNEKTPTGTYDKYGGYKKVDGEATGKFSLQVTETGKWSLMTPEGNAFFSLGVNKIHHGNVPDDVFKEKYGNSDAKWAEEMAKFIDEIGFNTIGNTSTLSALLNRKVLQKPFTVSADFVEWENGERFVAKDYPDVWDEDTIEKWDDEAQRIANLYGTNKYLVGVWIGNEWNFNLRRVDGLSNSTAAWWRELVAAEGQTPAKQQWVALYERRYSDNIVELNAVYGTNYTSFDDLYDAGLSLYDKFVEVTEDEQVDAEKSFADILDWNTEVGRQAHKIGYEALKKYMPNTVVFSERMVQGTIDDMYLEKIRDYMDVLAANHYSTVEQVAPSKETLDHYYDMVQKPVYISEHTFTGPGCGESRDGGHYPEAASQTERATAHLAYRNEVLEHPYVIGVGWHELYDVANSETDCGVTNFGLRSREDNPYQEMIDAGAANWSSFNELRWDITADPLGSETDDKLAPLTPTNAGVKQGVNRPNAAVPDLAPLEITNFFSEGLENPSLIDKDDLIFGPQIQ